MPVLMVQHEVKKNAPASLEVLVDHMTAVQNITRFASSQGYEVVVKETNGDYHLILTK